jgi:hypothetical protein
MAEVLLVGARTESSSCGVTNWVGCRVYCRVYQSVVTTEVLLRFCCAHCSHTYVINCITLTCSPASPAVWGHAAPHCTALPHT